MKINSIVSLELDENVLKLIHFSANTPLAKILAAGAVELSSKEPDLASEELKTFLSACKIQTRWAIVCFSRLHATTRILELPSTNPSEIRDMISFQAVKSVPFSKDEIVMDYTVLGTSSEGFSKVHVVVVPKNLVDQRLSLCASAGLEVLSLRLNSQEAANYFDYLWKSKQKDSNHSLFVDFDKNSTQFLINEGGNLHFSRSINLSKGSLTAKEPDALNRLHSEINNSLSLYKKEFSQSPLKKIILVGAPASIQDPSFLDRLSETQMDIEIGPNSTEHFKLNSKKCFFDVPIEEISISALLGVGLNLHHSKINFLPEKIDQEIEKKIQQGILFRSSLVFTGLILLSCVFLNFKNLEQDRTYSQLKDQTIQTKTLTNTLLNKEKKIHLTQKQKSTQYFVLDVLAEIVKLIPKEVSLDSLSYDSSQGVYLKGTSYTLSDVVKLIPVFEKSPFFKTVSSKGTTTKKIKQRVFTDFQLELPFASSEVD